MIPGLLATEVSQALREFIVTGYESETEPFAGEFRRLVEEADNGEGFIKGPYISASLPFLQGDAGTDFFSTFATAHPPYKHQEQAWRRIASNKMAANTLVATGTGSGKTECFLYPLLDHCKREAGKGIKAIVIYPMNALATDQAKRFAQEISRKAELSGLTVGLYVGGGQENSAKKMTDNSVIACKETLQDNPPDILLTNYKMLDYMLVRPKDQRIWRHNNPDTLKYLIVDELHTFDGAQGTDLALLLRRLKSRLESPKDHVIHVGTSATMGGGDSATSLLNFASDIFSAPFNESAVIGEQRETTGEFISNIEHLSFHSASSASALKSALEVSFEAFLAEAVTFVFNNELNVDDIQSDASRVALGEYLKQHGQLLNLLNFLNGKPRSIKRLAEQMAKHLPAGFDDTPEWGVLALLTLVAHARDKNGRPLVTMRAQLWTRELRRILGRLQSADYPSDQPLLTFADDNLKAEDKTVRLPLVQCRECHGTAWLSKIEQGLKPGQAIEQAPETIYSGFFRENPHPDIAILVPTKNGTPLCTVENPEMIKVCSECGGRHSQQHKGDCAGCGADSSSLILLARPVMRRDIKVKGVNTTVHDKHCPYCDAHNALIIFGARAATLSSVAIHRMFSSRDNDDKKLIAFSDSVQDATHRAGFFAARTWTENIRAALTQVIAQQPSLPLSGITKAFEQKWLATSGGVFDEARYLKEFMPPDRRYTSAFEKFEKTGQVEKFDELNRVIKDRVYWMLLQDFTWRHKVGRSLHRVGVAALEWDQQQIINSAEQFAEKVYNSLGADCSHAAAPLLAGAMHSLVAMGAFDWRVLDRYAFEGKTYLFNMHASLPNIGNRSPRPRFPGTFSSDAQVNITKDHWWLNWCKLCLEQEEDPKLELVGKDFYLKLIEATLDHLETLGLLISAEHHKGKYWRVKSDALTVTTDVCQLDTAGKRPLLMPVSMSDFWQDQIQLDGSRSRYEQCQPVAKYLFAEFYQKGEINRVIAHEHTGLLAREEREGVENSFINGDKPWELNLLSATPTLEMGIDIGDLSSVLLCSVPPNQANYLQRIGRGGRRDGNAFVLTIANAKPHDLVFYASPERLFDEPVDSPAIFLKAKHVLRRQLLAFCMDTWAKALPELAEGIPQKMQPVLDVVEREDEQHFPFTLLSFIAQNKTTLWQLFQENVAANLPKADLNALEAYFVGDGSDDELRLVVLRKISEQVAERSRIKKYTEKLQREIKKLKAEPVCEERDNQIAELEGELSGHRRLRMQLHKRDVLNFFTDEGLLPNYAFPEEGTTLRSVIFRKEENTGDSSEKSEFLKREYEYQRPARAALTELAPNSVFYAGNRKVTVNRVETARGENIEQWRFCQDCSFSAKETEPSFNDPKCPRCQSNMWSDQQSKAKLLKMTQVYAFANVKDTSLDDANDNREPLFFNRQMLIDFEPKALGQAWQLEEGGQPFGFEFINKARFTEVNFGQRDHEGESFFVAGEDLKRAGFKICRECGSVQKGRKPEHLHSCSFNKSVGLLGAANTGIEQCLYLYREFNSEALRILLPRLATGGTQQQLNSFVAALQLGLKLKFGGRVDHLQIAHYSEPVNEQGDRRHFVALYDTVPGGTGYLHDLVANVDHMRSVFQLAYQRMQSCDCYNGEHDGCYRCLLEYRNSNGMANTSKQTALEMLKPLIDPDREWIERSDSLSKMDSNPWIDSELEARFPAAVERYNKAELIDGSAVRVRRDIVAGKTGYKIDVGEQVWTAELQAEVSGIAFACKPDLLLTHRESKPIAIFLDGYEYHKDIVEEDLLKRMSLMNAGYLVWSLNWYDINQVLGEKAARVPLLETLLCNGKQRDGRQFAQQLVAKCGVNGTHWQRWLLQTSLDRLVSYMNQPMLADDYKYFAYLSAISMASMSDFMQQTSTSAVAAYSQLPSGFTDRFEQNRLVSFSPMYDENSARINSHMWASQKAGLAGDPSELYLAIAYQCDSSAIADALTVWQLLFTWVNAAQFLPNVYAYDVKSLHNGMAAALHWPSSETQVYAESLPGWFDELDVDIAESLLPHITLLTGGVEIGYELEGEDGEVIAEAELALLDLKIALLLDDEDKASFQAAGWNATDNVDEFLDILREQ